MQNDGITFINSHFADAAASFALLTSKLLKLEYGVTTHAYDIFTPQFNLHEKLANARFVLTCTNYNKTALLEHDTLIQSDKVRAIYHGIDTAKFERESRPQHDVVELFSVGRLVPKKGFDILISACAQLRDHGFDFKCRIVGDGPLQDHLAHLIDETRLHDEVELVGSLPSTEIKAYYERADIFVLPCLIEDDGNRDGIPNVIAEAMAMELPVVSSRISGIPELVADGKTGFLNEQRDVDGVVEKLSLLIRDQAKRLEMGAAGRERVKSIFDSKVCLQNLYDFYMKECAAD
jgi:glycosyltransferase involved in cell wall biosynthesis